MLKDARLQPIRITDTQKEWLDKERAESGNTFASIVRGLLQAQIAREAKELAKM